MLPGSRLTRLIWLVLLAGAFLAFDGERAEAEEALASWYGPGFEGRPTASGELYDPNGLTAAHKTLPLGTEVLVSYGGRTVPVTINDRGPFVGERALDLSQGAARELGLTRVGVDYVDWTLANGNQPVLPQETVQQPEVAQGMPQQELEGAPAVTQPGVPSSVDPAGDYPRTYPPVQEVESDGGAYTVQPGDTLASIAARTGTPVADLAGYNGIADPNTIYDGQALYFPLLVEDASGAGGHGTTDGAPTQSQTNVGGGYPGAGGDLPGPVHQHAPLAASPHGTMAPMAP